MNIKNSPIILVPGFAGSKLVDNSCVVVPKFSKLKPIQRTNRNDFVNLNIFDREWKDKFKLKYDNEKGLIANESIDVYDFGGVNGIQNLCDDCTKIDGFFSQFFKTELINSFYNYKYYDDLIAKLESNGYKSGINLYGAPYDFRKIMMKDYLKLFFQRLKHLIEDAYQENGKPSVLVAHSIGCLIIYIFLVEYCNAQWKSKYVKTFVSVGGPFGGSSIAFKTILSGLPRLSFLKERYENIMQHSSGLVLALPNQLGYNSEYVAFEKKTGKKYSVNNFFELLPDVSRCIWQDQIREYIPTFLKNTDVATIFVITSDRETETSYIYEEIDKNNFKEPDVIKLGKGDGVITVQSLNVHQRNFSLYSNYTFYEIDDVEHTSILHGNELYKLITSYAE